MIYVGSNVMYKGKRVTVSIISDGFFNVVDSSGQEESACLSELEPIPLKEEDLTEHGFSYSPVEGDSTSAWNGWWVRNGIELGVSSTDPSAKFPVYAYISDKTIELKWLHQLQTIIEIGERFNELF